MTGRPGSRALRRRGSGNGTWLWTVFLAWVCWWTAAGCAPAKRPPLDLTISFTCDTHGRLVPCGCFTGQFGGLTRLKTALDGDGARERLRVDVGDAIAGAEDYDVFEYGFLLRAYASMGFDALNLGHREAALSATQLRDLAKNSPVPMIGANLMDAKTGAPIVEPYRIVRRGEYRIAVVGVLDPRGLSESLGEGLAVEKMESVLTRLLPQVRPQADLVVLLAFTDEGTLSRLAQEFYELDVILGGKVSQPAQELTKANRSLISFVTNESRALGVLRLLLGGTQRVAVLAHDVRLLHARIPQDASVAALAAEYRRQARQLKLRVDSPEALGEDRIPGTRVAAEYAGTSACLACHPSAAKAWRSSGHARAFAPLVAVEADADPKCVGCHVVGFGAPSGYRREFGAAKLIDVGCESCHGPGSLHVRQRQGEKGIEFGFRPLGAGDCQKCHYGEFSRPFDWDSFWPAVKHGKEPVKQRL